MIPLHNKDGEVMNKQTVFKVGQIVGACFLIAAVASCQMHERSATPVLILLGGLIYGGSRIAAWLAKKE